MGKNLAQFLLVSINLVLLVQGEPPVPSLDLVAPGPIGPQHTFTYSDTPQSPPNPTAAAPAPIQDSYQPAPPSAYPIQGQTQQVYYEPASSNYYYNSYEPVTTTTTRRPPTIVYGPPPSAQPPRNIYGVPAITTEKPTTPRPVWSAPSREYGPPSRFVFRPANPPRQLYGVPPQTTTTTTTPQPIYLPPQTTTTTTTTTTPRPVQGYSYNKPQGPQIVYGPPTPPPQTSYQPAYELPSYRPSRFTFRFPTTRYEYVPLRSSYFI